MIKELRVFKLFEYLNNKFVCDQINYQFEKWEMRIREKQKQQDKFDQREVTYSDNNADDEAI